MSPPSLTVSVKAFANLEKPPSPPATPTVPNILRQVIEWLRRDCPDELLIPEVNEALASQVEARLQEPDWEESNIRCTWTPDRGLIVWMPSKVHEVMVDYTGKCVVWIGEALAKADTCCKVFVESTGTPLTELHKERAQEEQEEQEEEQEQARKQRKKERAKAPDAGFRVVYGDRLWENGDPKVVIEVAYSQSVEAVKDKCCVWLWDSPHVRAVILYKISHPADKSPFKAHISVWVRNSAPGRPLLHNCQPTDGDISRARSQSQQRLAEGKKEGARAGEASERSERPAAKIEVFDAGSGLNSTTMNHRANDSSAGSSGWESWISKSDSERSIRTRVPWITVLSEEDLEGPVSEWSDVNLTLKLFDFIPVCPQQLVRNGMPANSDILLPLQPLRDSTRRLVKEARGVQEPEPPALTWEDLDELMGN